MSQQVMAVAVEQQRQEMLLAGVTANRALLLWEKVNPSSIKATWATVAPQLFMVVARAQSSVALQADPYLEQIAAAQDAVTLTDAPVNPRGYVGVASDGRPLAGALLTGPLTALAGIASGIPVADAMNAGRNALKAMVTTQVADTFRASSEVSMFMRDPDVLPDVVKRGPDGRLFVEDGHGRQRPYFRPKYYVRMVQPGACSRCIILAGVRYRRRMAFNRHPDCHCTHIPVDENLADVPETDPKAYFDNLSPAEQDKAFGKAGAEAIRAGADMNQVVNARRGMTSAGSTTEGTSKRGLHRAVSGLQPRMMPEQIFRVARTREEAVRLLRENAFIF
jgi:hypothetical protein